MHRAVNGLETRRSAELLMRARKYAFRARTKASRTGRRAGNIYYAKEGQAAASCVPGSSPTTARGHTLYIRSRMNLHSKRRAHPLYPVKISAAAAEAPQREGGSMKFYTGPPADYFSRLWRALIIPQIRRGERASPPSAAGRLVGAIPILGLFTERSSKVEAPLLITPDPSQPRLAVDLGG